MALVDVTELLYDPDFVDPVSIVHRTPSVNSYGENSLSESTVSTIGSVQPTTGKDLERIPEAIRFKDIRTFWVHGEIKSDGTATYPDLLVWKGQRYEVVSLKDWTNFGLGWTEGFCVREAVALV